MIKTAGANVSAAEVEKAIGRATGGAPAYVFGLPDARRGQVVAAVIVRPDGAAGFDEAALVSLLETELSVYKIPKRFVAIRGDDVPVLSSGKVDMRRLRELFGV
jgi:acyl-CoA synthetase (AMP-forming)/AMP-acid ligase II